MKKIPSMPINVGAVLQEAMDVEAARAVPLCVSVLLDEAAPADLVAFVRSSFASASPQARVSVNYFENGAAVFDARSDMAVIAAGLTPEVGDIACRLRDAGIPAMVVTTMPALVADTAEQRGYDIPEGDLIAPDPEVDGVVTLSEPVVVASDGTSTAPALDPNDPYALEPYALGAVYEQDLSRKMGEWVVAAFKEKRLAFAQAFEFVRRPLSMEAVSATSFQNAGVGVVAIIPGADLPVMTLNQAKMVLQIAAAYGQPISSDRAKEIAAVVGGGFACRAVARQLVGVVPALGWAIKGAIGYAGTVAMGNAAIEYFEHGGDAAGVAAVVGKARDAATYVMEETPVGQVAQNVASQVADQAKSAAAERAREAVVEASARVASAVKDAAQVAVEAAQDVAAQVASQQSSQTQR